MSSIRLFRMVLGLSFAVAASAVGRAEDGEAYLLRYKFTPGQTVFYDVKHTSAITTTKGDYFSETATNESNTRKHYQVVAIGADGSGELELIIDRVRMSARFGQQEPVTYDSATDPVPPRQFEGVGQTIGKPLARVTVTSTGRLIKATPILDPTVRSEVAGPNPGGAADDNDPSKNFLVVLPDDPVQVGETWKDKIDVSVSVTRTLSRKVTLLRRYTLERINGDEASIRLETSVLTPVPEPEIRGQLIQRTLDGTIAFDMDRGVITSRDLKVDKTEIGPFGEDSSLRAVSRQTERYLSPDELARENSETETE